MQRMPNWEYTSLCKNGINWDRRLNHCQPFCFLFGCKNSLIFSHKRIFCGRKPQHLALQLHIYVRYVMLIKLLCLGWVEKLKSFSINMFLWQVSNIFSLCKPLYPLHTNSIYFKHSKSISLWKYSSLWHWEVAKTAKCVSDALAVTFEQI